MGSRSEGEEDKVSERMVGQQGNQGSMMTKAETYG